MKKVLKKFNRTLSIMLAVAMVLTMVPQTTMPVLAAEVEASEDEAEPTTTVEEGTNEDESADAGETITDPENEPDEEETTEPEEPAEPENPEPTEEPETSENPEESEEPENPENPEVEAPEETEEPEEEVVEPTIDATLPEEIPAEEPSDGVLDGSGADINAVVDTASEITVEYKNDPESDETSDTAEVIFLGGCVSSEGKLAEGRDLRFKVEPSAGRYVTKVEHQIGDAAAGTTITATNGVYSVAKASFVKGSGETAEALSGKIIVTTKAVNYKISFDAGDSVADSYKIYAVVAKSESDETEVIDGTEVSGAVDIAYGESKKFALVLTDKDGTVENKLESITLDGGEITPEETALNKKDDAENADKTACYVFTVEPSKAGSLGDTTENDKAESVNVKVVAKAKLTVEFSGDNANSTVAAGTEADGVIAYKDGKFGTDSTFVEDDAESLAKSLAFKVSADENYKITGVTAKATTDADQEGTDVAVVPGTPGDDGAVEYKIALSGVGAFSVDTTLTISIAAEFDTAKDTVHTINFKNKDGNAPAHAAITHGSGSASDELKNNTLVVSGDSYKIKVDPEEGYELAKGTKTGGEGKNDDKYVVTVVENRKYPAIVGQGGAAEATKTVTEEVEAVTADGAQELTLTLKGKDNFADTDSAQRDYVVTSVDVIIDTNVVKNDGEKIVHFDDKLGAGYSITTTGVILDEEAEEEKDTWVIPEGVDILTFTVASTREPAVTVDNNAVTGTAAEGVYTYDIPAMALTEGSVAEIVIDAKAALAQKDVKVKVEASDVTVKYNDTEESLSGSTADKDGYYTLSKKPEEGSEITLAFVPKPGVVINTVSYEMGEATGSATPGKDGSVTLELTVADDINIVVDSVSDYRVVLTGKDGEELAQEGNAYVANYTDTDISIGVEKAGEAYEEDLYDVVVKDGDKTAATEAAVSGASATIAKIDKSEYGKDLTIEVYLNKSKKYTTTLKTNAVSDTVSVTRMVNGKAAAVAEGSTVEMMPDAKMEFTVAPAAGASLADLDVEILAADGTALAEASTPVERSTFEDGVLTVQTKAGAAKDTQVLVSVYNKNEEKAAGVTANTSLKGGKFTLKLTDPLVKSAEVKAVTAVAGSGTNRAVRLSMNVDFLNKKNLPAAPIAGDLYYKVELTAPTGAPAGVTVISGADLVRYVKVEDYANPATTLTIPVVVSNTADDQATGTVADIAEIISTTAKVTLVQSLKEAPAAEADYVAGPEAAMKDSTLTTKAPVYETKLSVKAVNGGAVFTGQEDAVVANPAFGQTTAYDTISVQFVNAKTGVLYGSLGSDVNNKASWNNDFKAWVGEDNSIHVGITNGRINAKSSSYKDLGVKVTAVAPDESYAASAIVKLKLQQGIYDVDVDESKAKLPETLFKDPAKKGSKASVKITPLLNGGSKDYKPAKSTVTWEIAPAAGNNSAYAKAALAGAKPLVSVKNGTVSVAADYQVQAKERDNTFTVTIRANDFAGNGETVYTTKDFEITDEKNTIGRLVVLDGELKVKNPETLTAEDFDYHDYSDPDNITLDESKCLYVVALKEGTKEKEQYTDDDVENFLPVTFKSGNAKALAVDNASGLLTFAKPADKIKITANTVDGGKAPKMELVINVKPYKQVGLYIVGADEDHGPDETDIHYSGGSNQMYYLYAHYAADENVWHGLTEYKNLKVAVKGGKFLANKNFAKTPGSNYMGSAVVVTDKSGKATITVTDTANKDKATNSKVYTITNDSNTAVKAPSIKLYDPKKVAADTEKITWQVTDKNNDNYAGSYVKLTPDFTVTASNPAYSYVGAKGTILKIDENGRFTLDKAIEYEGAYKMIATVGTMANGEFVASTKDVKLNFSIPVKKMKTNLTVKGSVTLDEKGASWAVIDVKSDYNYEISEAMNVIKKTQDKDDHTNEFTRYFEVGTIRNKNRIIAYTLGLKDDLTAEELAYITSKEAKDDCTGYITVSNGYGQMGNLTGRYNTRDVQVKVSFKAGKYSLTGATVFSNGATKAPATATVKLMNGKSHEYAALVGIDVTDDKGFAKTVGFNEVEGSADEGDIVITSDTAELAPGKYTVKLIVVPQDSKYVKWDGTKWIYVNDKVEGGKPLTQAELIAKAGIPVSAKIDVKAVDSKNAVKAKNLSVTLTAKDYVQKDEKGAYLGKYVVDVPYTMIADGADIASAAVNLKNAEGADQNEIGADKEKLVTAERLTVKDEDNKDVDVIRLSVSKKALNLLNDEVVKTPTAKVLTNYGKKLKVPVTVKYTNGVTTEDTLNFNVTMPKTRPMDFAAVQTSLGENKALIEKIQTSLLSDAESVLTDLMEKVSGKAESLIPADTDVAVSYELTKKYLNDGEEVAEGNLADQAAYDEIMTAGKAKITLTLTDVSKAKDNTADVSFTYTLGMNAASSDVQDAVSAIGALNDLTFENETTAASLLAEIKEAETVKPYLDPRKGHLSVKIVSFEKDPATTKAAGTITAEIQVKDLVTGESEKATVNGTISQLSSLSEAKEAVAGLFDNDTKVQAFVDKSSGQEAVMKELIKKAAVEAANNKAITIDFKADTDTVKGWDYKAPKAATEDGGTETSRAAAEAGSLKFTLVLTKPQDDGNGSRSMSVTVELKSISETNAGKYVSLADAKAKIEAKVTDGTDDKSLSTLVATATTPNDADAIKTAIEGELDKTIKTDASKEIIGYSWAWAKKTGEDGKEVDDFTYTPATQENNGKISFKLELTLEGAKEAGMTSGVTETITVTDAEVVDKADKYQTAEELKAKIEAIRTTTAPIKAATVPTDATTAKTALENAIKEVNKADPAVTVTVENVAAAEGVTGTTFEASEDGATGAYKNVKITIGTGESAVEFTHDFNFAKQEDSSSSGS